MIALSPPVRLVRIDLHLKSNIPIRQYDCLQSGYFLTIGGGPTVTYVTISFSL